MPNYANNWALNLTGENSFIWVNPRLTVHVAVGGDLVNGQATPMNEPAEATACDLPPKTPGGPSPGKGVLDSNGNCITADAAVATGVE